MNSLRYLDFGQSRHLLLLIPIQVFLAILPGISFEPDALLNQ